MNTQSEYIPSKTRHTSLSLSLGCDTYPLLKQRCRTDCFLTVDLLVVSVFVRGWGGTRQRVYLTESTMQSETTKKMAEGGGVRGIPAEEYMKGKFLLLFIYAIVCSRSSTSGAKWHIIQFLFISSITVAILPNCTICQ